MRQQVCVVHTTLATPPLLRPLFAELLPAATVHNIVDDSLLHDAIAAGGVTPAIAARLAEYVRIAADSGADVILDACSSVGEAAELAAATVAVPVLRIDAPMAEAAVAAGRRIAVIGTVASTLAPSCRLIARCAAAAGRDVEIAERLVPGAFDALTKQNDRHRHNDLVMAAVRDVEASVDVIVLAQASMTELLPDLGDVRVPILTSPRLAVQRVQQLLAGGATL
jgi:aspartate/glutamate racemase